MFSAKPTEKKHIKAETGLDVEKASYGAQGNFVDVTDEVRNLAKDGNLGLTVSAQALGVLDPAPGVQKTFQVKFTVNGGASSILEKNDGEVVSLNAPPVTNPGPSTSQSIGTAMWYFFMAICGSYFGMSAYRLGAEGFKSSIYGYILGAMTAGAFFHIATADVGMGILGLIFALPSILSIMLMSVFFYSLYDPNAIDYSYANTKTV